MTERPHILFVDDEASVLSGLRRTLRRKRDSWDMSFAVGSEEALASLNVKPCDVLVSDFRMPGMDGGALLQFVRDRYPHTARVILSGHTDEADLLRVLLLAHQFVHKPCPEDDLVRAIERVISLRSTLTNEDVRREIAGIESLPSPPSTLRELLSALESQEASARSVTDVLEQDPAAVAKVLQVVNSSSSAVNRRISDVGQAVALLGLRNVRALVLMHDLVKGFDMPAPVPADWVERLSQHSVQASRLARHLAGNAPWAGDAFAAGLLLDVGQLVLASCRPDAFARHLSDWSDGDGPLSPIETATFGIDHAAIGAYLLGLWGLPFPVIEAVAKHVQLTGVSQPTDVVGAAAVAHAIVESDFGPLCGRHDGAAAIDEEQLDSSVRKQISQWRAECERDQAVVENAQ
jgi:HD-like signal output (HDOD) protein/CheY-like chemotaxis protein